MPLDAVHIVVLLAAGLVAGFVNTLAGGGSLLTIPALVFAGLPSTVANATNRVAVVMQTLAGSTGFYRERQWNVREAALLGLPAFVGAAAGAQVAASIPQRIFDPILGGLLLLILATLFLKPAVAAGEERPKVPRVLLVLAFLGIGFYGGFIQAGVGFLLIAAITWGLGQDLVRTNALKTAIACGFSVVSLAVFVGHGQVMWLPGLVLAAGNVVGAVVGVRFAVRRGAAAVRWVVTAAVVASALKLFGLLPL